MPKARRPEEVRTRQQVQGKLAENMPDAEAAQAERVVRYTEQAAKEEPLSYESMKET